MKLDTKNQKGFSLFVTVVFMSIMLSIVIGLNTVLFGQLRSLSRAGDSVVAFYAADAGAEFTLKTIVSGTTDPLNVYTAPPLANGASYVAVTKCCEKTATNPDCIFDAIDPCPIVAMPPESATDTVCMGKMFCAKVTGNYNNTRRVIELDI